MINLIPPTEKEALAQEKQKKLVSILGFITVVFLAYLFLVFFAAELYIGGQAEIQKIALEQKKKEFQSLEIRKLEEKIVFSNKSVTQVKKFYENKVSLVEIVEVIHNLLPNGVYLNRFDYKDGMIILSGFSATRSALLQFREALINEGDFFNVVFPGEPWIKPSDIDFLVSFELKKAGE